ncbi:hypothetical protein [Psychrobacillus sp. MER TA 171]|uniref:hypothetical protein n=1 Tax=Psychrobacillus sp. MER TA 171 TaxID=2939577 RepID=UPI00203E06EB|nr:hypothetical protein [Psychrobacillus sp. MER TA 171]MCM3356687.1 hypothetical protein [Psychrobacillus sp. MER TA 171]
MFRNTLYILSLLLIISTIFSTVPANASSTVNGLFLKTIYEEVTLEDKTTEKRLSQVILINEQGKEVRLTIDKYTPLYINSTPTTIGAFKEGLWVEAIVDGQSVRELNGFTYIEQGSLENNKSEAIGQSLTGTVNEIDKGAKYIAINLKDKKSTRFYLDEDTEIYKDNKIVDLSVLYVGDRIKLKTSEHDTNTLSSIEITTDGIKVENIYKGVIQQIDSKQNKLVIKNEKAFINWNWRNTTNTAINSKSFTDKTPIFLGTKKIDKSQLRNYRNNEIYYVTVKQSGKEIIQKMIIKKTNERTLHESLYGLDTKNKNIKLTNYGTIPYHSGTIIIRNGRLVDPTALQQSGKAFVIANGASSNQYANVIHITNDGFQSANLADYQLYFGQINYTNQYQLSLSNPQVLSNNYWYSTGNASFSFSNDTVVTEDYNNLTKDFTYSNGKYGYFYVKDNHIIASKIVGYSTPDYSVSIGRYNPIHWNPNTLSIKDVSEHYNSDWLAAYQRNYVDLSNTMLIKEGRIIKSSDLKKNDRLYMIHNGYYQAKIILVD